MLPKKSLLLDDSGNYYYQFFLWSYLTTRFITHKVNRFQDVEDDFKTKQFFRIWYFTSYFFSISIKKLLLQNLIQL